MDLHQVVTQRRTLVIEGCDGVSTSGLTDQLTLRYGFAVLRAPPDPHPADPTVPYHEALRESGRLAFAPGFVSELVYGPLRRGRSRVTWIQAFDLAEAVAERDGAFLHLTAPLPVLQRRLTAQGAPAADRVDLTAAANGYERALRTLAQYAPVLTLDESDLAGDVLGDVLLDAPCPCSFGTERRKRAAAWATHQQALVTDGKLVPLARDARQENSHGRRPGHPRSAGAVQD